MASYTIISDNRLFLDETLAKIKKKHQVERVEEIESGLFDDAVFALNAYNLFDDKKIILLKDPSGSNKKMLSYLDKEGDNIFLMYLSKDTKAKSLSEIKAKTKVLEDNLDLNDYIKEAFLPLNIDYPIIKFLRSFLSDNKDLIRNEIMKIKLYKDEGPIDIEDIKRLVSKHSEVNVFEIINLFLQKKGDMAYQKYNDLNKKSDMFFSVSSLLKDSLIIMRDAFLLQNKNYSDIDIIKTLKVNQYRYKNTVKYAYNFNLKDLYKLINTLNDLDIDLKKGKSIDGLFEAFLYQNGEIWKLQLLVAELMAQR